ncbi:cytidine deaminase [Streptomyces alkaliphilus]|uniref:cytidine deaminase n=1 Tax=Streptomyces alkaliphilus TaxID=1472722 RepID=UPI00117ECDE0|nr:cytidine deaminase [Streptomyces alkaliphilus]
MTAPGQAVPEGEWDTLRAAAREAARRAYAPYSSYPVGAAARVDDGRIVTGCNVENASYGLGLCAECGLVSALHAGGGGVLTRFTCVNGEGEVIVPCGRCRQLLMEHGGPELLVETPGGVVPLDRLLALAFGPQWLPEASRPAGSPPGGETSPERD